MKCNCNDMAYAITKDEMPKNVMYFQELNFIEMIRLPEAKPDINSITSVMTDPGAVSVKMIKTPTSVSYEGQNLSGHKLIVELEIPKRIKYTAKTPCQSVHSAHYDSTMKSVFIVVPEKINDVEVSQLLRREKYSVTPYVLHIYTKIMNKRTILVYMSILVDLRFC